ncbi:hypothetical protein SVAN01_04620 [Stagonosporopsis vannaccii]|nr:hypothetical protein SVAN01_04620 [Stagonosporopsis vannaccii]
MQQGSEQACADRQYRARGDLPQPLLKSLNTLGSFAVRLSEIAQPCRELNTLAPSLVRRADHYVTDRGSLSDGAAELPSYYRHNAVDFHAVCLPYSLADAAEPDLSFIVAHVTAL